MIIWCTVALPVIGLEVSICTHTDSITDSTVQLSTEQKKKGKNMICKLGLSSNRAQLEGLWIGVSHFICAHTQIDEALVLHSQLSTKSPI